jgi:BASS family bile acid:Na+ symporter
MLERYLILWLSLLSGLAYFWPKVAGGFGDPFVASQPYLSWLIALAMFCVGSLMRKDEAQQIARQWPTVLAGTAVQYTAMPLLGFACAHLFALDPVSQIGVIMVGCVPGAMASNVLTMVARGNVSYSVSLTTSATMLSPIVVPLTLYLTLHKQTSLDPWDVARLLVLTVAGPVVVGFVVCRLVPAFERLMIRIGPLLAHATILWIIAVVVGLNRQRLQGAGELQELSKIILALLVINLLGYVAGYAGGRAFGYSEGLCRALTIEVGMQNAGLGTTLVLELFPEPEYRAATIPTALYTFGCMLTATMLAQYWAWRDRRRAHPADMTGPA